MTKRRRYIVTAWICAVVAAGLLESPAVSGADRKADCAKAKQKIRRLQAKMRQGYTAKQGVRWQDELRRLRKIRAKACR